jgi:hypothetical protein
MGQLVNDNPTEHRSWLTSATYRGSGEWLLPTLAALAVRALTQTNITAVCPVNLAATAALHFIDAGKAVRDLFPGIADDLLAVRVDGSWYCPFPHDDWYMRSELAGTRDCKEVQAADRYSCVVSSLEGVTYTTSRLSASKDQDE